MVQIFLPITFLGFFFFLIFIKFSGVFKEIFIKFNLIFFQILLTFAFLVIGFSLSFMIQFRSQSPFDSPWAAMVKTMVMMTSEFDYESIFDDDHTKNIATSLIVVRVMFLIFLVLAAIVLMNLMVGVAVNDINDLEILGNIRRLAKQVEFLSTLDTLVYNKVFKQLLPTKVNNSIKGKRNVRSELKLNPGKPRWKFNKILPARIRDLILTKALSQKKQKDMEIGFQDHKTKIDEIYKEIVLGKEKRLAIEADQEDPSRRKIKHEEILKHLNEIDDEMAEVKDQITTYIAESKSPIDEINVKMDQMSLEMESIKQFLVRLESKIGRL